MSDYVNKICPFCKTEIQETDEIVICSACEMPHHKECWIENQGCTTFGCTGTIKSADNAPSPITSSTGYNNAPAQTPVTTTNDSFCSKCGAANPGNFSFCSKCGNQLKPAAPQTFTPASSTSTNSTDQITNFFSSVVATITSFINKIISSFKGNNNNTGTFNPTPTTNPNPNPYNPTPTPNPNPNPYNPTPTPNPNPDPYHTSNQNTQPITIPFQDNTIDPDIVQLIGEKSQYYIPEYTKAKTQGQKISWNWAAFFFSPAWFMYRKMYIYAAAIWGVNLLSTLAFSSMGSFLSLAISAASGLLGNYLYSIHLDKHAQVMKSMDPNGKNLYANKNGKTSMPLAIGASIAYGILVSIITNL